MKKAVSIKITVIDKNITLDGKNLQELTEANIIDIIKMLVSLFKTLNISHKGDPANGNA